LLPALETIAVFVPLVAPLRDFALIPDTDDVAIDPPIALYIFACHAVSPIHLPSPVRERTDKVVTPNSLEYPPKKNMLDVIFFSSALVSFSPSSAETDVTVSSKAATKKSARYIYFLSLNLILDRRLPSRSGHWIT
jgi:hypothetical protein